MKMKIFVLLSCAAVLVVTATAVDPLTHIEERQDGQDEGSSNENESISDIVKEAIINNEPVVLEPVADPQQVEEKENIELRRRFGRCRRIRVCIRGRCIIRVKCTIGKY